MLVVNSFQLKSGQLRDGHHETFSRSQVLLLSALDLPLTFAHTNLFLCMCAFWAFVWQKSAHLAVKFISFDGPLAPCAVYTAHYTRDADSFMAKLSRYQRQDTCRCRTTTAASPAATVKVQNLKPFLVIPLPTNGRGRCLALCVCSYFVYKKVFRFSTKPFNEIIHG